jgi:ankyrin repeat protein
MFDKTPHNNSWNEFLTQLRIDPEQITQEDVITMLIWCRSMIKSDLSITGSIDKQVAAIKTLYSSYINLDGQNLDEPANSLGQLNVLLQAAKSGFDRFLDRRLSQMDAEQKKSILASTNNAKNNALHIAALYGLQATIDVLIKHGCSPDASNMLNKLPVHLCLSGQAGDKMGCFNHLLAVTNPDLLLQRDTDGENLLFYSIRAERIDVANQLVKMNNKFCSAQNKLGETAYHVAIQLGHGDYLPELELPSSVLRNRTSKGATLLHYAAIYNDVGATQFLMAKAPDLINTLDFERHNALETLMQQTHSDDSEATEVMRLLLMGGINLDKHDEKGKTLRSRLAEDERFVSLSSQNYSI